MSRMDGKKTHTHSTAYYTLLRTIIVVVLYLVYGMHDTIIISVGVFATVLIVELSSRKLTRDGTTKKCLAGTNFCLRNERRQGKSHFPCSADHEQYLATSPD